MSKKNYDNHNRWRNKTVAFRVSAEESPSGSPGEAHRPDQAGLTSYGDCWNGMWWARGNPRVYKALRDQLAAVLDELCRIEAGQGVNDELLDTIQMISTIMNGMQEDFAYDR